MIIEINIPDDYCDSSIEDALENLDINPLTNDWKITVPKIYKGVLK